MGWCGMEWGEVEWRGVGWRAVGRMKEGGNNIDFSLEVMKSIKKAVILVRR